jgi:copper(I)-binding protein
MQSRIVNRRSILVVSLWVLAGCGDGLQSPPVGISDLRVLAPVPGASVGVAYCVITNGNATERRLVSVGSPHFERVEMHATVREGDRVMMQPLSSVQFEPGEAIAFAEGGRHLMLWNPVDEGAVGDVVELYFSFDDGLVVVGSTTMRSRLD